MSARNTGSQGREVKRLERIREDLLQIDYALCSNATSKHLSSARRELDKAIVAAQSACKKKGGAA